MKTCKIGLLLLLLVFLPLADAGCVTSKKLDRNGDHAGPSCTPESQSVHSRHQTEENFLSPQSNQLDFMSSYLKQAKRNFEKEWNDQKQCDGSVNNYDIIGWLAKGGMSEVVLGQLKGTDIHHAIKIMHKQEIVKQNQLLHILNEKRILKALDFPFIIKMESCFKDNSNLYIAMEYCSCGTLPIGLTENVIKFYAAQLVLVLHYLHSMNIIYQDLKPQNVLIGNHGNIKLADFGVATRVVNGRSSNYAGTMAYLAPEVMNVDISGFDKSVDLWSLGALIYQVIKGRLPFNVNGREAANVILDKIQTNQLQFDDRFSVELQDLLSNLMQIDPHTRYGIEEVVRHKWFEGINWRDIFNKKGYDEFRNRSTQPHPLQNNQHKIKSAIGVISEEELFPADFERF